MTNPETLATLSSPEGLVTQGFAIGGDAAGNAIAAFATGDGYQAQYAAFDGAGPIVRGVSTPGEGAPGVQQPFTVSSVTDTWSPVLPKGRWFMRYLNPLMSATRMLPVADSVM